MPFCAALRPDRAQPRTGLPSTVDPEISRRRAAPGGGSMHIRSPRNEHTRTARFAAKRTAPIAATCAGVIALAGLAAGPALADPVADFYTGKQITIWVGYGAGGGYDTTSRLLARHYGAHIPGNPNVVVQNMPGAGSLLAANNLYNTAPRDGTVLGVFSSTVAMLPFYQDKQARFETLRFSWIGSIHQDVMSCGVWRGAGQGIRNLEDMIKAEKPVTFGSDGQDAPLTRWPLFMKNVLGANINVVAGYKGTKAINLAMQQGEAHASCGMFESSVRGSYMGDLKSGDLTIFVQTGYGRNVELFGDATNLYDLLKTPEDRQLARLVFGPSELTRPLAGPPDVPEERVKALRQGMLDAIKSPGFTAEAEKLNIKFDPLSGEGIVEAFEALYKTPPELVKRASEVTSRR